MAGKIIVSTVQSDTDNSISFVANTGATIFSANISHGIAGSFIADGSITGPKIGLTAINANNIVDGAVTVSKGGTGLSTLTANSILIGNGTSSPQLIAPGTSANVLTSNGTNWVSSTPSVPSAGTGPAFNAYQSSQQSVNVNTWTKVNLQTELFDTNSNFASNRFTPTVEGYYQINGGVCLETNTLATYVSCAIYKNGVSFAPSSTAKGDAVLLLACNVSTVVYLNGSTDYIELYYYGKDGILYLNQSTYLCGALVRAA